MFLLLLSAAPAWPRPNAQAQKSPQSSTLYLVGGVIVDVGDWGRSARDLQDAVVVVRDGRIIEVGSRMAVTIPKNARIIDCSGKYLLPGLIDGYAGLRSQAQANAFLYMGVTTVVASNDARHGPLDAKNYPSPHLYLMDSVGTTDNRSLLRSKPEWSQALKESSRPAELTPEQTSRQLTELAHMGVRAVLVGPNITAANAQMIVERAHQMRLATYGEFISTPYKVGVEAGVDALLHMGRYELGLAPDELQRPLVKTPQGASANTAYDYVERLPESDAHMRSYARFLASHHAALMPAFSIFYLRLPGHRNLWREPVAKILDRQNMYLPSDPATGEAAYPLFSWARRLPNFSWRWMEENQRKRADQSAERLWRINQVFAQANPHYLAASGASAMGSMPGISLHTELEMMVRLGLTPREALAAATNNYALQFGWYELGLIAPGRRADILVLDENPAANIWNARRIALMLEDGNVIDREKLLASPAK